MKDTPVRVWDSKTVPTFSGASLWHSPVALQVTINWERCCTETQWLYGLGLEEHATSDFNLFPLQVVITFCLWHNGSASASPK